MSFLQRFNKAKKECSVLIDNSRVSPSNGIVKISEAAEDDVEHLFYDVLLAEDDGNITIRQNNMDCFIEEIEKLRVKYFPQCWKYKQDRHAVSCYMCFFAPDKNYIYHYTEVEKMAQYIEYGTDIGSGESFNLRAYYNMCDAIVEVLREHESLLSKHKKIIGGNDYYNDESLHLLAFNLIWCANTYNFYQGMTHAPKKEILKEYTLEQLRKKEAEELDEKRNQILNNIKVLEQQIEPCLDVSLIGVQVSEKSNGIGTVIKQDVNRISVKFSMEKPIDYIISCQYIRRPRFEDDEEIVEMFTEYENAKKRIQSLNKQLEQLN